MARSRTEVTGDEKSAKRAMPYRPYVQANGEPDSDNPVLARPLSWGWGFTGRPYVTGRSRGEIRRKKVACTGKAAMIIGLLNDMETEYQQKGHAIAV